VPDVIPVLFSSNFTLMFVSLSAAFFCLELTIGPIWAVPMDVAPRYAGTASGFMNAGSGIAGIISPVIFGLIIDGTGNWTLPFAGSAGLLLPFLRNTHAGVGAACRTYPNDLAGRSRLVITRWR
jgi:MFS family permease